MIEKRDTAGALCHCWNGKFSQIENVEVQAGKSRIPTFRELGGGPSRRVWHTPEEHHPTRRRRTLSFCSSFMQRLGVSLIPKWHTDDKELWFPVLLWSQASATIRTPKAGDKLVWTARASISQTQHSWWSEPTHFGRSYWAIGLPDLLKLTCGWVWLLTGFRGLIRILHLER